MTTDTVAKAASRRIDVAGRTVTITGISKGAGMIRPNMATMLGFIATDAGIATPLLQQLLACEAADASFNCITVDGDTSTNDSFLLIATGPGRRRVCRRGGTRLHGAARGSDRRCRRTGAGDHSRRRRRQQVHQHRRRRGPRPRRMQARRLCHRALAAGQDRFLRFRSQPRPHPGRHRLRRA
jgi:hypothetical protein